MNQILSLIQSAIVFGTVIMLGALGEILTEKSGNLNLGVPGIMSLGAIGSLIAGFYYELYTPNPAPFLCMIVALFGALLLSLSGRRCWTDQSADHIRQLSCNTSRSAEYPGDQESWLACLCCHCDRCCDADLYEQDASWTLPESSRGESRYCRFGRHQCIRL